MPLPFSVTGAGAALPIEYSLVGVLRTSVCIRTLSGRVIVAHFLEQCGLFFGGKPYLIFMRSRGGIQQVADPFNQRCRFRPPVVGKQLFEIVQFLPATHRQPQRRFFYGGTINGFPHRVRELLEGHVEVRGIPN